MTTRVVISNFGPAAVEVRTLLSEPVEELRAQEIAIRLRHLAVGEFYVHDGQRLLIVERPEADVVA